MATRRLGIVVGGGPAPGINAVIGAATIEAINRGFEVIGIYDGFSNLVSDKFDPSQHAVRLMIPMVARIHFEGGSILRTARTNLLDNQRLKSSTIVEPDPKKVSQVLANFEKLKIDSLLTIGGDDTSLSARFCCDAAQGKLHVVHCPKTIDNDLPLPHGVATFGFHTAMNIGTQIVKNLMRDSQTTNRWYFVEAMGRTAGWLAQSIAQAAGATLAMIPEEFPDLSSVANMADVIEGSILKRRTQGRKDGVAVIAEGVAYRLGDQAGLERLLGYPVPVDAAGHPRLSEVPWLTCSNARSIDALKSVAIRSPSFRTSWVTNCAVRTQPPTICVTAEPSVGVRSRCCWMNPNRAPAEW
jgi:6-phosphofructokinase